jgi:hypothetical protein
VRLDEDTKEMELPKSNVVHVNFTHTPAHRRPHRGSHRAPSTSPWLKDIDVKTPWILRLLAVLMVLILSMLII